MYTVSGGDSNSRTYDNRDQAARRTFTDPGPLRDRGALAVRRRLGATKNRSDKEFKTTVTEERARSIIARNDSPDVPFEQSINPYRGCEHGCIYCYARPSHAYLELSPGLDFETRLFAKTNAVELLKEELSRRGYRAKPIAFGTNTDCYQPIERRYKIMRGLLEVLAQCDHPLTIVTKSALVERDIDLLAPMARKNLVKAFVSDHHAGPPAGADAGAARREPAAARRYAFARSPRPASPAASWSRR